MHSISCCSIVYRLKVFEVVKLQVSHASTYIVYNAYCASVSVLMCVCKYFARISVCIYVGLFLDVGIYL